MPRRLPVGLLSVLLPTLAFAQSVGAIPGGAVTDETGGGLPNVTVTIVNANGRSYSVATDPAGGYRVVALQPAIYRVEVSLAGFERFAQELTLTVGTEATLNVQLAVAGVNESVTVAPATLSADLAQSQPSSTVTGDQIRVLPEIGRNFLVLAQLLPGSGPLNASVGRFMTTKFGGPADQRSGFTTLIDGGAVDDVQWGRPTINLTQESVREFKSSATNSTRSTAAR